MAIRRCSNCGHPETSHEYSHNHQYDLDVCLRRNCDCISLDGEYDFK